MKLHTILITTSVLFAATMAVADVNIKTQDLNGDGKVTFEEFLGSHDASIARNQAFIDRHKPIFDAADQNNDGVVDASESQGGTDKKSKTKVKS
jgi:hypothetical protein